jgi:hypothetical protein
MAIPFFKHNPLFRSAPLHQTTLQRMERNKVYQQSSLICSKCRKEKVLARNLCRGCLVLFG